MNDVLLAILAGSSFIIALICIWLGINHWIEKSERKMMKSQEVTSPKPKVENKPIHVYQVMFTDPYGTHTQTVVSRDDVLQVIKDISLYGGQRPIHVLSVEIMDDRIKQEQKEVDLLWNEN